MHAAAHFFWKVFFHNLDFWPSSLWCFCNHSFDQNLHLHLQFKWSKGPGSHTGSPKSKCIISWNWKELEQNRQNNFPLLIKIYIFICNSNKVKDQVVIYRARVTQIKMYFFFRYTEYWYTSISWNWRELEQNRQNNFLL